MKTLELETLKFSLNLLLNFTWGCFLFRLISQLCLGGNVIQDKFLVFIKVFLGWGDLFAYRQAYHASTLWSREEVVDIPFTHSSNQIIHIISLYHAWLLCSCLVLFGEFLCYSLMITNQTGTCWDHVQCIQLSRLTANTWPYVWLFLSCTFGTGLVGFILQDTHILIHWSVINVLRFIFPQSETVLA